MRATVFTRGECAGRCLGAGVWGDRTIWEREDAIVPTVLAGRVGRAFRAEFTAFFGALVSDEPTASAAATTSSAGTRTSAKRRTVNTCLRPLLGCSPLALACEYRRPSRAPRAGVSATGNTAGPETPAKSRPSSGGPSCSDPSRAGS